MIAMLATLAIGAAPTVEATNAATTKFVCEWEDYPEGIEQYYCSGDVCPGDILYFRLAGTASSYSWSVSHGASIISGGNSRTVTVQSPSSGGFTISLNAGGTNYFTLAQYSCF